MYEIPLAEYAQSKRMQPLCREETATPQGRILSKGKGGNLLIFMKQIP